VELRMPIDATPRGGPAGNLRGARAGFFSQLQQHAISSDQLIGPLVHGRQSMDIVARCKSCGFRSHIGLGSRTDPIRPAM